MVRPNGFACILSSSVPLIPRCPSHTPCPALRQRGPLKQADDADHFCSKCRPWALRISVRHGVTQYWVQGTRRASPPPLARASSGIVRAMRSLIPRRFCTV